MTTFHFWIVSFYWLVCFSGRGKDLNKLFGLLFLSCKMIYLWLKCYLPLCTTNQSINDNDTDNNNNISAKRSYMKLCYENSWCQSEVHFSRSTLSCCSVRKPYCSLAGEESLKLVLHSCVPCSKQLMARPLCVVIPQECCATILCKAGRLYCHPSCQ